MILFTSDNNLNRVFFYTAATVFFALFGAVYELFSHEVYSYFMIYAFAVPLLFGILPSLLIILRGWKVKPAAGQLYGSGVMAFTLSCVFKGVLDIYGTESSKLSLLPLIGLVMIALAVLLSLPIYKKKNDLPEHTCTETPQ